MVIRLQKFQELLVGSAVVVPTYHEPISFLIVAEPTAAPGSAKPPRWQIYREGPWEETFRKIGTEVLSRD
jgi:hypothetical protein